MDLDLNLPLQKARAVTRRQFLRHSQTGLGAIALAMLMGRDGSGADQTARRPGAAGPSPLPSAPWHWEQRTSTWNSRPPRAASAAPAGGDSTGTRTGSASKGSTALPSARGIRVSDFT